MRLFELLLIVTNVVGLFSVGRNRTGSRVIAAVTVLVLGLHIVLEHSRWQMMPAYLVAALVILAGVLHREIKKFGRILLLLPVISSLLLAPLFPIIALPPTSGQYGVGTTTDVVVAADGREIVMQVWYPATIADEPLAPYIPQLEILGPGIATSFNLPSFLLNHVNLIEPRAYADPALAASDQPYPLILFSHGYGGLRSQNTFQVEELASQGYIVAATDHHPHAIGAVFPDGTSIMIDRSAVAWDTPQEDASAQEMVDLWTRDFIAMTDALEAAASQPSHFFYEQVDTTNVGAFGQSTGGGTSYEFCYRDSRCQAALGLDPWVVPTSDEAIATGLERPMLALSTPFVVSEANKPRFNTLYENNRAPAWWIIIDGTTHYDYTDFPHLSPALKWAGISGDKEPMELTRLINDYTRSFFNHHLQGGTGALLYMESTIFPDATIRRR